MPALPVAVPAVLVGACGVYSAGVSLLHTSGVECSRVDGDVVWLWWGSSFGELGTSVSVREWRRGGGGLVRR